MPCSPIPSQQRQAGHLENISDDSSFLGGADARWRELMGPDCLSVGEAAV